MDMIRPEIQLLKYAARTRIGPRAQRPIEQLLSQSFDWGYFRQAAVNHGVAALCYAHLLAACPGLMPDDQMEWLRLHARSVAARALQLASKLVEIDAQAERAGIPLVPYKGPVLAELAYGNLGSREFVDLDFILPHGRLREAWDLLEDLGYRPANPAPAAENAVVRDEYVFVSNEKSVHVELRTELTLRHFPSSPDLAPLLAARVPVTLAGKRVLTFCPEDTLTLLAVHGAKDFWARLLWICDVAWLVQTPGFDWDCALDRSAEMGCRRMTHIALLLASESLGTPMPRKVLAAVQEDAKARTTARWLIQQLFAAKAMQRWEQLRYRMGLVEGFWPGLRYAARLGTAPATEDLQTFPLPQKLSFLYRLVRPIRLLFARDKQ